MRHIKTRELQTLFSMAKQELLDTPSRGLDDHENLSRCWLVAIDRYFGLNMQLKFPMQQYAEPDDE